MGECRGDRNSFPNFPSFHSSGWTKESHACAVRPCGRPVAEPWLRDRRKQACYNMVPPVGDRGQTRLAIWMKTVLSCFVFFSAWLMQSQEVLDYSMLIEMLIEGADRASLVLPLCVCVMAVAIGLDALPHFIRNLCVCISATSGSVQYFDTLVTYGREQFLDLKSEPVWVETYNQVADCFTKALDKTTFFKFRDALLNIPSPLVRDKLKFILGR